MIIPSRNNHSPSTSHHNHFRRNFYTTSMPKVSQQKLIIHLSNVAAMAMLVESDSEDNSDLEEFYYYSLHLLQKRYLKPRHSAARLDPRYDMLALQELPDSSFLQLFRMRFPCFLNLLQLLQPNPIFYNNSHNPQRELPIQLAIAICRLGSNGNGSAVYRLRNLFQLRSNRSSSYR
ncbi:hypothetical protein MJO29_004457 [Puccinia striiformis f. sp. tritici]|nr:hypothetical protein MJO29_004457 [Puccinia striiformis f. sp. tritici]